jgi:hypothetical protein
MLKATKEEASCRCGGFPELECRSLATHAHFLSAPIIIAILPLIVFGGSLKLLRSGSARWSLSRNR